MASTVYGRPEYFPPEEAENEEQDDVARAREGWTQGSGPKAEHEGEEH